MERILETHRFGSHEVVVLEHVEDEGTTYSVVVDGLVVTDTPLAQLPSFEDVVRIYARWQEPAAGGAPVEG